MAAITEKGSLEAGVGIEPAYTDLQSDFNPCKSSTYPIAHQFATRRVSERRQHGDSIRPSHTSNIRRQPRASHQTVQPPFLNENRTSLSLRVVNTYRAPPSRNHAMPFAFRE